MAGIDSDMGQCLFSRVYAKTFLDSGYSAPYGIPAVGAEFLFTEGI